MTDKIFEYLIDNPFIKTKKLEEFGCGRKEINDLIELGVLKREKKGIYVLVDAEDLYHYGKKLMTEGRYERGFQCVLRCNEICPSHSGAIFQLFVNAINNKNYSEAFKHFDTIFSSDNEKYFTDAKLYLLLLKELTNLPEKYQHYVQRLQYDDIKVLEDDVRYPDKFLANKMRLCIYNRQFSYALNQLNSIIATRENKRPKVQDFLMKTLLIQILNVERKFNDSVMECYIRREYHEMVELFREKERRNELKRTEQLYLRLIEVILQVIEGKTLVEPNFIQTTNFYQAIDNGDYILAYNLSLEYNERNNIDSNRSLVTLLLGDIVSLINNPISYNEQKDSESNFDSFRKDIDSKISEVIDTKDVVIIPCKTLEEETTIRKLLSCREDIGWFATGEDGNRIIVLKHKEIFNEWPDFRELFKEATNEYINKNYDAVIDILKKFIGAFNIPDSRIFERIGFAYLKKRDKEQAIKYITIADAMNKEKNGPKDFSDLLLRLQYKIPNDDKKTRIAFTQSDFKERSMSIIDSVTSSIIEMMNNGVFLDDACNSMNLDYKGTLLAKLYVAREYYRNGNATVADRIFQEVEGSKNKPPEVVQEADVLRCRRRFLQYKRR